MRWRTVPPSSQPTTGMRAWNSPKCQARRKVCLGVAWRVAAPVAMATAKASMARATARGKSSVVSIAFLFGCLGAWRRAWRGFVFQGREKLRRGAVFSLPPVQAIIL